MNNATYTPPVNSPYPASLEYLWHNIATTYSPGTIDFFSGVTVELLTFWLLGFLYTFVFPSPPLVPLQPVSRRPGPAGIRKAALGSLRNQIFIWIFHGIQCFSPRITGRPFRSHFKFTEPLPRPEEIAWQFAIAFVGREAIFYYGHRSLHHPKLYKWLHKKHHEFVTPVAWSAQYCTFTEHVVSNILPLLIPAVLLRMHIVTFFLWSASQSAQATIDHAGYSAWPWWQAAAHDKHHELFRVNFGTNGLLDWVHGTNEKKGEEPKKMHYD